ncbi:MAG TPA: zinc-ribbon domain-containing protein [Candidatus Binataceae bacterium]|nr:zinc-ribbon domain-containing protein [Candidatus Binataceae bacterium]
MFCSICGAEGPDGAVFCRKCGSPLAGPTGAPRVVVVAELKSPGLAAVLSFLWCGLGQIYNGQIGKGIVVMVVYAISAFMIHLLIGLLTTPVLWIWGMVDAYRTAERINRTAGVG